MKFFICFSFYSNSFTWVFFFYIATFILKVCVKTIWHYFYFYFKTHLFYVMFMTVMLSLPAHISTNHMALSSILIWSFWHSNQQELAYTANTISLLWCRE